MRYVLPLLLFLFSCSNGDHGDNHPAGPAVRETGVGGLNAGTLVVADSMQIPDPLNKLYFSVKVIATEHSFRGTYDVIVVYGANEAKTEITLPQGTKKVRPGLRKGDKPFSYIIGFRYGDDPAFYDYFLIQANKGQTEMKYLKAYQLP